MGSQREFTKVRLKTREILTALLLSFPTYLPNSEAQNPFLFSTFFCFASSILCLT